MTTPTASDRRMRRGRDGSEMWSEHKVRSRTLCEAVAAEAVHDFRNILQAVSMLSEVALMHLPEASPVSETVHQIKTACLDASELCNWMLDDACVASREIEQVDLSALVTAIAPQLATYVPADSALRLQLADTEPKAAVCSGQIRQLVMNLVKNAAESLSKRSGSVTVSTGVIEHSLADVANCDSEAPGMHSFLEVSDTGCGMDAATQALLIERSFSTKADGHGLGMASIRRIVRGCGGVMHVHSQVGEGTRIRVLFPRPQHIDDAHDLPAEESAFDRGGFADRPESILINACASARNPTNRTFLVTVAEPSFVKYAAGNQPILCTLDARRSSDSETATGQ